MNKDVKFRRSLRWYAPEIWLRYELSVPFEDIPRDELADQINEISRTEFVQRYKEQYERIKFKVVLEEGSLTAKLIAEGVVVIYGAIAAYGAFRGGIDYLGDDFKRFGELIEPRISNLVDRFTAGIPYKITHRGVQGRLDEALRKFKGGSIDRNELEYQIILIFQMTIDNGDGRTAMPFYRAYVESHCPGVIEWNRLPQHIIRYSLD